VGWFRSACVVTSAIGMLTLGCRRTAASAKRAPAASTALCAVDSLPAGVNRDWFRKDCDLLRDVRALVPFGPDLGPILEKARNLGKVQTADLGLGIERTSIQTLGGYVRCEIVVASSQDRLLVGRFSCSANLDAPEITGPIVESALGSGFVRSPSDKPKHFAAIATEEFADTMAKARADLDRELGPLSRVEPTPDPSAPPWSAYQTLMSPLEDLVLGSRCGVAADVPRGRSEITTLRLLKRIDLIRTVLRGPNPAARVYAKRALVELAAVSPVDQAIIDRLATLPVSLRRCSGCTYGSVTSAVAFRARDD